MSYFSFIHIVVILLQRRHYKQNKLSQEKIYRLNESGFSFSSKFAYRNKNFTSQLIYSFSGSLLLLQNLLQVAGKKVRKIRKKQTEPGSKRMCDNDAWDSMYDKLLAYKEEVSLFKSFRINIFMKLNLAQYSVSMETAAFLRLVKESMHHLQLLKLSL